MLLSNSSPVNQTTESSFDEDLTRTDMMTKSEYSWAQHTALQEGVEHQELALQEEQFVPEEYFD
jgi:hypothetical protein